MFCSEDALVHLLTFCEFQYNGSFLFFFEKTNYLATVSVNDPSICSLPSLIVPPPTPCTPSISRNPTLSTLGLPYSTLWWRWKWFSNNLICDHSTCCLFMKTIFMILISSLHKWKQMSVPEISSKYRPLYQGTMSTSVIQSLSRHKNTWNPAFTRWRQGDQSSKSSSAM